MLFNFDEASGLKPKRFEPTVNIRPYSEVKTDLRKKKKVMI